MQYWGRLRDAAKSLYCWSCLIKFRLYQHHETKKDDSLIWGRKQKCLVSLVYLVCKVWLIYSRGSRNDWDFADGWRDTSHSIVSRVNCYVWSSVSSSPRPWLWLANKKDDPINSKPTLDIQADTVAVSCFKHFPKWKHVEKTPDILDFYQQALMALPIRRIFSGVHVNNLKCTVMRSKSVDGAYDAWTQLCNFYSDEVLIVWTQCGPRCPAMD